MNKERAAKIKNLKSLARRLAVRQFFRTYGCAFMKPLYTAAACFTFIFIFTWAGLLGDRFAGAASSAVFFGFICWTIIRVLKTKKDSPLSLKSVTASLQQEYPDMEDRIINAISLLKDSDSYHTGTAQAVIDGLARETMKKARLMPRGVLSIKNFYRHLLYFISITVLFSAIFTLDTYESQRVLRTIISAAAGRSEYRLDVEPGDIQVLPGRDLEITAYTDAPGTPVLEYRMLSGRYSIRLSESQTGLYSGLIEKINSSVYYSVSADRGRLKSPVYKVSVLPPPEAHSIEITYNYPAYTGMAPEVSEDPAITALKGTVVTIKAVSRTPVKEALIVTDRDEIRMEIKDGNTFTGRMTIRDQSFYEIRLRGSQGSVNEPVRHMVTVIEDTPPEVELIMPVQDLVAAPDAKIEIRGRADDGFGLSRIYIRYYIGVGGEYKEEHIKRAASRSETFSYVWNIENTGAPEGSVITYSVAADDINTLYGPGTGFSRQLRIEIEDFREHHRKILDDTEEFSESLMEMLEKSYDASLLLDETDFSEALKEIEELGDLLESRLELLHSLLERMEENPYQDISVMEEFSGIENRLSRIAQKDIPGLLEMTEQKEEGSAEKSWQIADELGKLASLSEHALSRQRMSDVLSAADETIDMTSALADMLEGDPAPEDIMQALNNLHQLMSSLMESLMEYPDRLPDEFIHQESMQKIDFEETAGQFEEIYQAIKDGDYDRARQLLKEFTESLRNMLDAMHGAAGSSYTDELEDLNLRLLALLEEIKKTAERQEKLIGKTEASFEKLGALRDDFDRKKIRELHDHFRILVSTVNMRFPEIESEFRQGYLYRTEEFLNKAIENTDEEWKKDKIREFLSRIKDVPPDEKFITEDIREDFLSQKLEQEEIRKITKNIKLGFESLSHQTAMMDMEIIKNLEGAETHMELAEEELSKPSPRAALQNERIAYAYLLDSLSGSEQLAEKLMSLPGSMDASRPSGFQRMPSGEAGARGFREGYVEIPAPGEDITGEEFRRRLTEALQQEFPMQYRSLIEEYFRTLTE